MSTTRHVSYKTSIKDIDDTILIINELRKDIVELIHQSDISYQQPPIMKGRFKTKSHKQDPTIEPTAAIIHNLNVLKSLVPRYKIKIVQKSPSPGSGTGAGASSGTQHRSSTSRGGKSLNRRTRRKR